MGRPPSTTVVALVVFAAGATTVVSQALQYYPLLPDDVLIGLRFAERLLEGRGLTWNDGERVEGYTNLLWILSTAGLGALSVDLVTAARALSMFATLACLAGITWAAAHTRQGIALGLAVIGFCAAGTVGVWTLAGFEQPAVAAFAVWALLLLTRSLAGTAGKRQLIGPGLLLALAALTRADGAGLAVGAGLGWLLARGPSRPALRETALLVTPTFAAAVSQTAFRLVYYDAWMPNTAVVKVVFSATRLFDGLAHVGSFLAAYSPLVGLCILVGLVGGRKLGRVSCLFGVPALLWMAYVAIVGGDMFPEYRQLLLVVVLACGYLAVTLGQVAGERPNRRWLAALPAGIALLVMAAVHLERVHQTRDYDSKVWEWQATGTFLRWVYAGSQPQPLVAVLAGGAIPYWSRLPTLDMFGLNDAHIARHGKRMAGIKQGHDLWDSAYVVERAPDLMVFTEGPTAMLSALVTHTRANAGVVDPPAALRADLPANAVDDDGRRMIAELATRYELVRFEVGDGMFARIFVRIESAANRTVWEHCPNLRDTCRIPPAADPGLHPIGP